MLDWGARLWNLVEKIQNTFDSPQAGVLYDLRHTATKPPLLSHANLDVALSDDRSSCLNS